MDRFKADPNDFIVVVMGPTGSGKTNFVNKLTRNAEKAKASDLGSATKNVTPYTIPHHGFRLVVVDTPGFDNTHQADTVTLRIIADWLTKQYPDGGTLRLTGIIYLHRITDNRMSGSAYKNLQLFGRLCGDVPLPRVRLVTTMWDSAKDRSVGERRETELISDFWQPLIAGGASAVRSMNTEESAWEIVNGLGSDKEGSMLLLQEELVEQQKRLNETEAGKGLYSHLQKLLAEQKSRLKDLADQAKLQNDPTLATSLQEEYNKVNTLLERTFDEMREMKIPLTRRILLWLFGRKSRGKAVKLSDVHITVQSLGSGLQDEMPESEEQEKPPRAAPARFL